MKTMRGMSSMISLNLAERPSLTLSKRWGRLCFFLANLRLLALFSLPSCVLPPFFCLLQLLLGFVNKHLVKMGIQISNVANQFHDGVYLIMLIGSLGNFFVPLYNYHIAPTSTEMKVCPFAPSFMRMGVSEELIHPFAHSCTM